jgi:hypothetical protein
VDLWIWAIFAAPVVLIVIAYVYLARVQRDWLDEPVALGALWARLTQGRITPRDFILLALPLLPAYIYSDMLPFTGIIWILVALFVGHRLWRRLSASRPEDHSQLILSLQGATSTAQEASQLLTRLSHLVESRQREVERVERIRDELSVAVEASKKDAEAWNAISLESKASFIEALRKDANRGKIWRDVAGVLAAIALNLVATIIWVMAGNPGQRELSHAVARISSLVRVPTVNAPPSDGRGGS